MTRIRILILLWVLSALALVGLGLLLLLQRVSGPPQPTAALASLGGPFTLTGVDGRAFSSRKLDGKPYAIFFGFTHCPDVCPTTLARLVRLRSKLVGSQSFNIVFVTVDPERDGPQELGSYLSLFHEPVIGLTGARPQIEQVKRQFGIYSQRVPNEAGGYTVDHTASALLFDRQGKFVATISPGEGDGAALDKLSRIVASAQTESFG